MTKPQLPQPATPGVHQDRDDFQTPHYGNLLIERVLRQWYGDFPVYEPASGLGLMVATFLQTGHKVQEADLFPRSPVVARRNYLDDPLPPMVEGEFVITNPPWSLKKQFLHKLIADGHPGAMLIPANPYVGWIIELLEQHNIGRVIPKSRINYVTPNTCERIWHGETWKHFPELFTRWDKIAQVPEYHWSSPAVWTAGGEWRFDNVWKTPQKLLAKYSQAQMESMFVTYNIPELAGKEYFVELTPAEKLNILPYDGYRMLSDYDGSLD